MTVTAQRPALADARGRPRPSALPARMPYLGGLDGVRAIAVAGVVVYHLGAPWMRGGFLGVDVFFVLSGYLITTIVLDEVELHRAASRSAGSTPARPPPAARARPAAGRDGRCRRRDARARRAELRGDIARRRGLRVELVADRRRPRPTSSWSSRPPLLQHLWSLAIEEQFYLVFPLVVAAGDARRTRARRAGRRRPGPAVHRGDGGDRRPHLLPRPERPEPRVLRHRHPLHGPPGRRGHGRGLDAVADLATGRVVGRASAAARSGGSRPASPTCSGSLALLGVLAAFVWVDEFSDALYRGGFLAFSVLAAVLVGAVADPPGCSGARSAASRCAGSVSGRTASTCGTGPSSCSRRPGSTSTLSPWVATPLRLAAVLGHRRAVLPVRRAAGPSRGARSRVAPGARRRPHERPRAPCCGSSPRRSGSWSSAGSPPRRSRRCPRRRRTPGRRPGSAVHAA